MIICIEGIDGSGKATQALKLEERLKQEGIKTRIFSFPNYNSITGREIKKYLNGEFGDPKIIHPNLIFPWYALNRRELLREIRKVDMSGIVILDRWVESNLAFQAGKKEGKEREETIRLIEHIEYDILELPRPNMIIYIDIPVDKAIERIKKRSEKNNVKLDQHEHKEFLENVRKTYLELAKRDSWIIVNSIDNGRERTIEEIHEEIYEKVINMYRKWKEN